MNYPLYGQALDTYNRFSLLKLHVDEQRSSAIAHRLTRDPSPTKQESILGAFIEMYEQHLQFLVFILLEKGYVIDVTSGFCGKDCGSQALNGFFTIDDLTVNKLLKIGVKFQKSYEFKSLMFRPDDPDLDGIVERYKQIAAILPQKTEPPEPSFTGKAARFRMTYIPRDNTLQKQRLFEILMFETIQQKTADVIKRLKKNPVPDTTEYALGAFREMIEPQVRSAVLEFHRKGYSTDVSGFMNTARSQSIEGDFSLEPSVIVGLEKRGITVETNPSGYTKISFSPASANLDEITSQWNSIAALLPDTKTAPSPSMTKKAREFRLKY